MPIIIDTNCLANVFSKKSSKHSNFAPVLNWILKGKGIIIYGGSKYIEELRKCNKYQTIIRLLREVGKVYVGNLQLIDQYEAECKKLITDRKFNDHHLAAIVRATRCRVICSEDTTSIIFVTNSMLYPKGFTTPVYYTNSGNIGLLDDKYVDTSLKPLCKMPKYKAALIEKLVEA